MKPASYFEIPNVELKQEPVGGRRFIVCHHDEVVSRPVFHTHDFCEIYYSVSGGNQVSIGGRSYTAASGDVFVIAPGERHRITGQAPQHYERFVAFASAAFIQNASSPEEDLEPIFLRHAGDFCHRLSLGGADRGRLELLLQRFSQIGGFGSRLMEAAAFLELLAMLGELYTRQQEGIRAPEARHSPIAPQLMRYIDERIGEPLPLSQIASAFYISDSYACRIFKEEYGITINKYIQNRRMSLAKSLLIQGHTVAETCERCGYNDYSHFIKAFTRSVGVSPKRYSVYHT